MTRDPADTHDAASPFANALDAPDAVPFTDALEDLHLSGRRLIGDDAAVLASPDEARMDGAVADIADALVATLSDTVCEPDLEGLLWGAVHLFHRAAERLAQLLDTNEQEQRESRLSRAREAADPRALADRPARCAGASARPGRHPL
jgi:hypothetical protein